MKTTFAERTIVGILLVVGLGACGALDSRSYVQRGLVAQWDAIENAARGTHDGAATSWTDLTGNGHDLNSFASDFAWTENRCTFPTNAYGLCGVFTGTTAVTADDYAAWDCFYQEDSRTPASVFLFGFGNWKGYAICPNKTMLQVGNGQGWTLDAEQMTLGEPHHAYAAYAGSDLSGSQCIYDGTSLARSSNSDTWTQKTSGLGYYNNSNWSFHGGIHALRLYGKTLSEAEVGLNRAIDLIRFQQKTTDEVALPAGYAWSESGTGVTIAAPLTWSATNGTVSVNGAAGTAAGSLETTTFVNDTITLKAEAAEGYVFVCWKGETGAIVAGTATADEITVIATQPLVFEPVFAVNEPVYARYANGVFTYYNTNTNLVDAPAEGMTTNITVLFSSDAEYQSLIAVSNEVAKAKALELEANLTLTADTDWSALDFSFAGHAVNLNGQHFTSCSVAGGGGVDSSGEILANNGFDSDSLASGEKTVMTPYRWTTSGSVSLLKNNSSYANHQKTGSNRCYTPKGKWIRQVFTIAHPGTFKLSVPYANRNVGNSYYSATAYAKIDGVQVCSVSNTGWGNKTLEKSGIAIGAGQHTLELGCSSGTGIHMDNVSLKREGSSASSTAVFEIRVPEGKEIENTDLLFGGGAGLQVWKSGRGRLVLTKDNPGFGPLDAATVVKEGVLAKATVKAASCGPQYGNIRVESGATFDIKGRSYWDYNYILNGSGHDGQGALLNTVNESEPWNSTGAYGYVRNISLGSDTVIKGTQSFGMSFWNYSGNTMTMNGHTLHYGGNTVIYFGNMSYAGVGTVVIDAECTMEAYASSPSLAGCTLRVDGELRQHDVALGTISNLIFTATGRFNNPWTTRPAFTVLDTYAPNINTTAGSAVTHPTLTLGTAESLETKLDLSGFTNTFDACSTTFYPGSRVTVDLASRPLVSPRVIGWETPPENVRFVPSERTHRDGRLLEQREDGVYVTGGTMLIFR